MAALGTPHPSAQAGADRAAVTPSRVRSGNRRLQREMGSVVTCRERTLIRVGGGSPPKEDRGPVHTPGRWSLQRRVGAGVCGL